MKENVLWQSQVRQIIRESFKIDLEIQIPGTLYFLSKSLACIFPNIFPCIIFRMREITTCLYNQGKRGVLIMEEDGRTLAEACDLH